MPDALEEILQEGQDGSDVFPGSINAAGLEGILNLFLVQPCETIQGNLHPENEESCIGLAEILRTSET